MADLAAKSAQDLMEPHLGYVFPGDGDGGGGGDARLRSLLADADANGFRFIAYPLGNLQRAAPRVQVATPITGEMLLAMEKGEKSGEDRPIGREEWSERVVGVTSAWINVDSLDPHHRQRSAAQLRAELDHAAHLGIQTVLLSLPTTLYCDHTAAVLRQYMQRPGCTLRVCVVTPPLGTATVETQKETYEVLASKVRRERRHHRHMPAPWNAACHRETTRSTRRKRRRMARSTKPTVVANREAIAEAEAEIAARDRYHEDPWLIYRSLRQQSGGSPARLGVCVRLDKEARSTDALWRWAGENVLAVVVEPWHLEWDTTDDEVERLPTLADSAADFLRAICRSDTRVMLDQFDEVASVDSQLCRRVIVDLLASARTLEKRRFNDIRMPPQLVECKTARYYRQREANHDLNAAYEKALTLVVGEQLAHRVDKRGDEPSTDSGFDSENGSPVKGSPSSGGVGGKRVLKVLVLAAGHGHLIQSAMKAAESFGTFVRLDLMAVESNVAARHQLKRRNRREWQQRVAIVDASVHRFLQSPVNAGAFDIVVADVPDLFDDSAEQLQGVGAMLREGGACVPRRLSVLAQPLLAAPLHALIRRDDEQTRHVETARTFNDVDSLYCCYNYDIDSLWFDLLRRPLYHGARPFDKRLVQMEPYETFKGCYATPNSFLAQHPDHGGVGGFEVPRVGHLDAHFALAAPQPFFSYKFPSSAPRLLHQAKFYINTKESVEISALCTWYECELTDGVVVSNVPAEGERGAIQPSSVMPLRQPILLRRKQTRARVKLLRGAYGGRVWQQWSVAFASAGRPLMGAAMHNDEGRAFTVQVPTDHDGEEEEQIGWSEERHDETLSDSTDGEASEAGEWPKFNCSRQWSSLKPDEIFDLTKRLSAHSLRDKYFSNN